MKIIDKIVVSPTPPTQIQNAAWFDGKEIKIPSKGKYESVGGGSSNPPMIEITWQELKDLRDAGNLIPGMKYRMIDYDTYTSQEDTKSAMHPFDLILTALDNKTLSEECSAIQSARDTEGYFASSNLAAWKVWYCLDNDVSRFNWAAKKGITCMIEPEISLVLDYYGDFEWNGNTYVAYRVDYGELIGGETIYVYALYSKTPAIGDTPNYALADGATMGEEGFVDLTADMGAMFSVSAVEEVEGKGVIYRLVDEYNNDVCYDFKNILFVDVGYQGALYTTYTFKGASNDYDGSVLSSYTACKNNVIKYDGLGIPRIRLSHEGIGVPVPKFGNSFINCKEVYIYVSDGGSYNYNTFIDCELADFGSNGGNYDIKMERCTITGCKGNVYITKTNNKLVGCSISNIENATIEGCPNDNIRSLYIRQKADGTIYSYTDEDIYNAITATKTE